MSEQDGVSRRRWPRRVLLVVLWTVVPVLLLLLFELLLRGAGYGQSTRFAYEKDIEGERYHVVNNNFYFQFLYDQSDVIGESPYDQVIPAEKSANTYRIFVLGGSAAQGWLAWDFSMGRVLETMLRAAYPDRDFEVHVMAYYGMNSHVMRHVAQQCAAMRPDLFVVYLGNNEMVGPFGLMSVLGRKELDEERMQRMVAAHIWASDLRLMQVFGPAAQERAFEKLGGLRWGTSAPVEARDDPRLARVYRHYGENLAAICAAADSAGAEVALATVGANQRDWEPRNPRHRSVLPPGGLEGWDAAVAAGETAEAAQSHEAALEAYGRALAEDDRHAGLRYRMGRCLLALGRSEEAGEHFLRAGDLDFTFDFANSAINQAIRDTAEQCGNAWLVDAAGALNAASPEGLSGREFFYDHIHLRFDGNYVVAKAIFEDLVPRLSDAGAGAVRAPGKVTCAARMGLSRGVRYGQLGRAIEFLERLGQNQPIDHLRAERAELEEKIGGELFKGMANGYRAALALDPRGRCAYEQLINLLHQMNEHDEALEVAREFRSAYPFLWHSQWALCEALSIVGDKRNALLEMDTLLDRYPELAETHYQHGRLLENVRRYKDALRAYRKAARMKRQNEVARYGEGQVLTAMGRSKAALAAYRKAIDTNPSAEMAFTAAEALLQRDMKPEQAVTVWQDIAAAHPDSALAHYYLGSALQLAGSVREAVTAHNEAVRLDSSLTRRTVANLAMGASKLRAAGDHDGAIESYRNILAVNPDDARTLGALARTLQESGDLGGAKEVYREIVAQDPGDDVSAKRLDMLLEVSGGQGEREAAWRRIAEEHPEAPWPRLYWAHALEAGGKREEAIGAFSQAAKQGMREPQLLSEAAANLVRLKQFEAALPVLRTALEAAADNARHVRPMLVKTHLALGDQEAALEEAARCDAAGFALPEDVRSALE